MAVLLARLSSNSRTSSKLPSSDGYSKPDPKSRRVKSGLKPGKQPGDQGHHLAKRVDPDVTVVHAPTSCRNCGDDLTNAEVTETITRRVFELLSMALFFTGHQPNESAAPVGRIPPERCPMKPPPVPVTDRRCAPTSVTSSPASTCPSRAWPNYSTTPTTRPCRLGRSSPRGRVARRVPRRSANPTAHGSGGARRRDRPASQRPPGPDARGLHQGADALSPRYALRRHGDGHDGGARTPHRRAGQRRLGTLSPLRHGSTSTVLRALAARTRRGGT